jgi:RimJ/RimL family protein N-acetyltransferase
MLETSRLKLVPLTHDQLLLYKNDPRALAEELNLDFLDRIHDPATLPDIAEALEFWITHTWTYRDNFAWFTNWEIILKDAKHSIGGIGFAGLPDSEGKTIVGYGLDLRYHGQGFATEALQALIQWGFLNPVLQRIIAETPLSNIPSQRVLQKNDFYEKSRDQKLIRWQLDR